MDRKIKRSGWSPAAWPLGAKMGLAAVAVLAAIVLAMKLIAGFSARTVRLPASQLTISRVEQGIFHDLIPLRASVVPRETVYIDAIDGGRVERVLVEAGDLVEKNQPLIELSNTNLALSIIQQESQLNQAISQLQQNEIALEQNQLSNDRAVADIEYNLVRLQRAAVRRQDLAAKGAASAEQRDVVADQLAYYRLLKPIQVDSGGRQLALRERLLPHIHRQLDNLRANLQIVRAKLDGLIIRAPVAGRVTAIDLKVGENRSSGQRLAEVTPDAGMKLTAAIDEFYLARVHPGQSARLGVDGRDTAATVRRVSPQVRNGQFTIDLDFDGVSPLDLVAGVAVQGHLQLGGDSPAQILPIGPFLERTGGDWVFVVAKDGQSAERRRIKVGRRNSEQLEILGGLAAGDRVLTSDYLGLDQTERIVLTK